MKEPLPWCSGKNFVSYGPDHFRSAKKRQKVRSGGCIVSSSSKEQEDLFATIDSTSIILLVFGFSRHFKYLRPTNKLHPCVCTHLLSIICTLPFYSLLTLSPLSSLPLCGGLVAPTIGSTG
eukprot:TRINITY_DN573_c0_g1_i14.p1 TRINITY_DN573_c0_g1~~TRINITY_DN573_c0_g1_i14.p1  ORF type:complete len:121 (+),score=2.13 TRINITY_DN573_c0_g1_i14:502-864(+)